MGSCLNVSAISHLEFWPIKGGHGPAHYILMPKAKFVLFQLENHKHLAKPKLGERSRIGRKI